MHGHHPGLAVIGYLAPAALSVGVWLDWYSQNISVIVGTVALLAYGAMFGKGVLNFVRWLISRPDE